MPIGDDALAAGFPIMSGNEQANTIETEINETRDIIARRVRVSNTAPTTNLKIHDLWAKPV